MERQIWKLDKIERKGGGGECGVAGKKLEWEMSENVCWTMSHLLPK